MHVTKINRVTGSTSEFDIDEMSEIEDIVGRDESGEMSAVFIDGKPFFACDSGKTLNDF